MRREVNTGLPSLGQPFSWAVTDGQMVYTSHGPVTGDGTILQGDMTAQTRLTLDNLRRAVEAAGGSLDDVLQVQLYLLDVGDMQAVDAVYAEVFRAPYPSRSTAVVAALVAPGMRIELLATARIDSGRP